MSTNETTKPPQGGGSALNVQLCACVMCAKRADCMPGYDDETLYGGAEDGHAPRTAQECKYHVVGDNTIRECALKERDEFNVYAENLVKGFTDTAHNAMLRSAVPRKWA